MNATTLGIPLPYAPPSGLELFIAFLADVHESFNDKMSIYLVVAVMLQTARTSYERRRSADSGIVVSVLCTILDAAIHGLVTYHAVPLILPALLTIPIGMMTGSIQMRVEGIGN